MTNFPLLSDRRAVLAGFGVSLLLPIVPSRGQQHDTLALAAIAGTVTVTPGQPAAPVWLIEGGPTAGPLRFRQGETVNVALTNRLPVPLLLDWIGLDGNPTAEPFTGQAPLAPNAVARFPVTFRHAGTLLAQLRPAGRLDTLPTMARAVIVSEAEPPAVDRDEVMLFQDWRLKPDGTAMAPGINPGDAAAAFTVNGLASADIELLPGQRLRFRLINASQAAAIAIKFLETDVRVIGIDGHPSEPFPARDGMIVLNPGSRVDAVIDATKAPGSVSPIMLLDGREARQIGRVIVSDGKPVRTAPFPGPAVLPSNGLPAQLDLKAAQRVDLPLGTDDWVASSAWSPATAPAFAVKRGRTVVLALVNRSSAPVTFHLHGHHFRLLDRLDDGWKPFWLDTLAVNTGQTQRIAFAAEFPGLYPMTVTAAGWASPLLLRSYRVT